MLLDIFLETIEDAMVLFQFEKSVEISLFDALEEVENIMNREDHLFRIDPTPIRPEGVKIVNEIQLTESPLHRDFHIRDLLCSILAKRGTSNQENISTTSWNGGPAPPFVPSFQTSAGMTGEIPEDGLSRPHSSRALSAENADSTKKTCFVEGVVASSSSYRGMNPSKQDYDEDPQVFVSSALPSSYLNERSSDFPTGMVQDVSDGSSIVRKTSTSRFRSYQSEQWMEKYQDLKLHQQKHGHCLVSWTEEPLLAQWVKRQRYQYKLKQEGKHSTMTDQRVLLLEELGFIWDSHKAVWEEKFNELLQFKFIHGHCNVPSAFPENPQLAIWVKGQRRNFRMFQQGTRNVLESERWERLNSIGFSWLRRRPKDLKSSSHKKDQNCDAA